MAEELETPITKSAKRKQDFEIFEGTNRDKTIEELVISGYEGTGVALNKLLSFINDLDLVQLQGLSSQYFQTKNDDLQGIVPFDASVVQKNRITNSFLVYLTNTKSKVESMFGLHKTLVRHESIDDAIAVLLQVELHNFYEDIKPFHPEHIGNTYKFFVAKEESLKFMIMVPRDIQAKNNLSKKDLINISTLKHRNIIQLIDYNLDTYPNYIISEFVEGISLLDLLKDVGSFSIHNVKKLMLIIGEVMNLLRRKNYLPIRAHKILIDLELEPEISPFDLLNRNCKSPTIDDFIEDALYFAPEMLNKYTSHLPPDDIDKANQFCLGALSYEMLTGKKLFGDDSKNIETILSERKDFKENEIDFMRKKFAVPPLNDPMLKRLQIILKKMLHHCPEKRYYDLQTALKEIEKIRVDFKGDEERIFKSYRRCLHKSDNFIDAFYKELLEDSRTKDYYNPDNKETIQKEFYRNIHLSFDTRNAVNFLESFTELESKKFDEYLSFLDVFIRTIKKSDTLYWDKDNRIEKAWLNFQKTIEGKFNTTSSSELT